MSRITSRRTGARADSVQSTGDSSINGPTTARGDVERRRGDGLGVGRTSRPAACKRCRNSRQAPVFAVPVSVTQPRCSHSVAANSWRANPGSHATVTQTSATSCAL
ncbi:MAG: hypothetical protein AW07_00865 [Candidatus Accumulibacter sp. SK-11]|nr:MAG: hypothetical protein AW07_00865 [Candidatus Accumulibacter sp. SK-11]